MRENTGVPDEPGSRFVRLATVGNLTEGRVLAARLHAEGIEVRTHSEALGPYPMTVGEFAATELWVLSDRLEQANEILLDAEVNIALAPVESLQTEGAGQLRWQLRLVALAVVIVSALLFVLRVLATA